MALEDVGASSSLLELCDELPEIPVVEAPVVVPVADPDIVVPIVPPAANALVVSAKTRGRGRPVLVRPPAEECGRCWKQANGYPYGGNVHSKYKPLCMKHMDQ